MKRTIKKFVFVVDKTNQQIGCKFTSTWLEEIDRIEAHKNCNKVFKSTQVSDKGQRPVEMKYEPIKGIKWDKFVKCLENTFDEIFK